MTPKVKTAQMILRLLCAMVFLSVGFGHRMPAAIAADAQSTAYELPDGTFADLCSVVPDHKRANPLGDCEACRLAGAVILPPPSAEAWLVTRVASRSQLLPIETNSRSRHLLDRPRLRGPPLSA